MIAEVGVFFLILSLVFSAILVVVPSIGLKKNDLTLIDTVGYYTFFQFAAVLGSFFCLILCFLNNDFTVIYVLTNSSQLLPWFYKICAVWGGHEGSMLLWVLILSFWTFLVSIFSKYIDSHMRARVLVVMGMISIGFIVFILSTSNPFLRQFAQFNSQGRDLNPLLQDPGFLFHPPMLYMGYVGFSVAFAFAIAALWQGSIDSSLSKWIRPWTLASWCCLTAGITLGSWWAYRELGWGGWWFWDPVENASFMPWLTGTALIHSLAVTEKQEQFKAWTIFLSITAFSLSLVGTFLVRSGVLTSVHAFAVDPLRGMYILGFLFFVIGGSLLLFMLRAQSVQGDKRIQPFSKEGALLLNNVFFVAAMLTVLMGTIYPLIIDGLGLGKLSVGAPYFNTVFVPLMTPMLLLMGLGIHIHWQKDKLKRLAVSLNWVALFSVLTPIIIAFATGNWDSSVMLGLILSFWIILSTLSSLITRVKVSKGFWSVNQSFWGMAVAHMGVAVSVIGIAVSSGYGIQKDVKMAPGSKFDLAGYTIHFQNQRPIIGPNYKGTEAVFTVNKEGYNKTIYPQKRIYTVAQMPMTESAIDVNPFRDIYIALGEPIAESAWSIRLYYKPFVRWIWAGGFLILLGGFIALSDRRYYKKLSYKMKFVEAKS